MIDFVVSDLIDSTTMALVDAEPASVDDVRGRPDSLLRFSDQVREEHLQLKRYLREHLYKHFRVLRMTTKARRVVRELFETMLADVDLMPEEHQHAARRMEAESGPSGRAQGRRRLHRRHDRSLRDPRAPRLFDPAASVPDRVRSIMPRHDPVRFWTYVNDYKGYSVRASD
jgi:dGTPase